MARLLVFALVGLVAQLVDGSLGMAYGVTSTTLLLTTGASPLAASASVHLAEVGTTLASGISHWRLGNVNWHTVRWIALPGGIAAFLGAIVLGSISAETAKPWVAAILLVLGAYILIRFSVGAVKREGVPRKRQLLPLGLIGGFLDAIGGGGWGPITTPTLIASGRLEPRRVIGSVSISEFVVAAGASVGFLPSLSRGDVDLRLVAALLVGGVVAAPLAALIVKKVSPRVLGPAIGGMILLTNARTIMTAVGWSGGTRSLAYLALATATLAATARSVTAARRAEVTAS